MAVGITTTDGKDLDERYIRKVSGKGPDTSGNVQVDVPVTSVQGKTGDVRLSIVANGDDINAGGVINNGATVSYTFPVDCIANISAWADSSRSQECTANGEDDPTCSCLTTRNGNNSLKVTIGGTVVYNKTASKARASYSATGVNVTKGTVVSVYAHRTYNYADGKCAINTHGYSIESSPMMIV